VRFPFVPGRGCIDCGGADPLAEDWSWVREHLAARGVGTDLIYPVPLHLQECFAGLSYPKGSFPVAEKASREVLSLPMDPFLTEAEQQEIADAVTTAVRK